jgi:hypothetical protein
MRADNYALSEETKRLRDSEQARLTDTRTRRRSACSRKHRVSLDRVARRCSRRRRSTGRSSRLLLRRRAEVALVRDDRHGSRAPDARLHASRIASRARPCGRSTTSASPSPISMRRSRPTRRSSARGRASRAARRAGCGGRVGARRRGRFELVTPTGDGHAGRPLPRRARPGHAPRRARGGDLSRRSTELEAGAQLIDRVRAGALRPRGRVRPSRFRPRRSHGGGCEWLTTFVRIEVGSTAGRS